MARRARECCWSARTPHRISTKFWACRLSGPPTAVPGRDGLFALNIDPEAAAKAYRERVIGPYRGVLPDAAVNSMEEQFPAPAPLRSPRLTNSRSCSAISQQPRVRSHHLRYGSHRTHASPAEAAGRMDRIHRHEHDRNLLSGASGRARNTEVALRRQSGRPHRRTTTTLVLVSRPERASLAEADRIESRTGRNGRHQSEAVPQRRVCRAGPKRLRGDVLSKRAARRR